MRVFSRETIFSFGHGCQSTNTLTEGFLNKYARFFGKITKLGDFSYNKISFFVNGNDYKLDY